MNTDRSSENDDDSNICIDNNKLEKNVHLIYESREDKPHLLVEKERIEQCGGIVYIPPKINMESGNDSSRVIVIDKDKGQQLSLAMSRSIGDWSFSIVAEIFQFGEKLW